MTPAQLLRDARALIATPERWTQGTFARDAAGRRTYTWADDACRWCAFGAVIASAGKDNDPLVDPAVALLSKAVGWRDLTLWNDYPNRTHRDILAGLDRAIALAEAEEAQP